MHCYDRQGNEIDMFTAAMKLPKYRRVLGDHIIGYWISTVWLGIDHGWGDRPMIFETMIWGPSDKILNYQDRYSTEVAARLGHVEAIAWVRANFSLERHHARHHSRSKSRSPRPPA